MHQAPNSATLFSASPKANRAALLWWAVAALCVIAGLAWFALVRLNRPTPLAIQPVRVEQLKSRESATLDSPVFAYSPGWRVDATGADPHEPPAPWHEPSGVVTFTYTGAELDLLLAVGDYWGYLYVTVDNQPANLLPVMASNRNRLGQLSGYKTFYAPEKQTATGTAEQWVRVHRSATSQKHQARLEVWRSWGQRPLRAVAVDTLPPAPYPRWPGIALLLGAVWATGFALAPSSFAVRPQPSVAAWLPAPLHQLLTATVFKATAPWLALLGILLIGVGVATHQWIATLLGLGLLAWAAIQRPALWLAALLFALPFYYNFPLPLFPGRSLSLIEVGIWGGIMLLIAHLFFIHDKEVSSTIPHFAFRIPHLILFAISSWALVATFNAEIFGVAFHEWRAVFLTAGIFALLLSGLWQTSTEPTSDRWWLVSAWLTGGAVVALVGIWQYVTGAMVITAEGVWRVRAFYGSPNNLALYLDRTLAVTLALALFSKTTRTRLLWGALALLQAAALLLTFSKGALLFGLPAMLLTLWWGGLVILGKQGEWRRTIWWIVGAGVLALLALTPFLGTERFQRLLDLRQGTGFLRLQLWQSAWRMALDHRLLGVGPDNFLYTFRSHYLLPTAWQEPNLNHPHNWLLDWWTRLGLPGLGLALLFFGVTMRQLWHGLRSSAQPVLQLGLLAAVITALAHGLIDASYALPDLMIVWVLLAGLV
ncbi:MAG: O-antigen ligase family protein [Caldilineaceae bacterium]